MKNSSVFKVLALLLVICALGFGQTTVTSTTLSAALSGVTTTQVRLASATGVTGFTNGQPTTWLYTDRELMQVVSVNGTTATVIRAVSPGSPATTHVSGAKVWVGPYNAFNMGVNPSGSCTAASLPYLPIVMVQTGDLYNCGNGQYTTFGGFVDRPTVGAAIASATTIAPTNPVFHVTGTTSIATITLPPACPPTACVLTIIPDGIFATTTAGNIALISTSVVSKALVMTYDPVAVKWFPSY